MSVVGVRRRGTSQQRSASPGRARAVESDAFMVCEQHEIAFARIASVFAFRGFRVSVEAGQLANVEWGDPVNEASYSSNRRLIARLSSSGPLHGELPPADHPPSSRGS